MTTTAVQIAPVLTRAEITALLPVPSPQRTLRGSKNTDVIVAAIMLDYERAIPQTVRLAAALRHLPVEQQLFEVWRMMRPPMMRYVEDHMNGDQLPKQPANLWADGQGDCKSYTIFISSVLTNLGIPNWLRLVRYDRDTWQHIYTVARVGSKKYVLDGCLAGFNREKPFTAKLDMPGQVVSIGNPALRPVPVPRGVARQLARINKLRLSLLNAPAVAEQRGIDVGATLNLLARQESQLVSANHAYQQNRSLQTQAALDRLMTSGVGCVGRVGIGAIDPATAMMLMSAMQQQQQQQQQGGSGGSGGGGTPAGGGTPPGPGTTVPPELQESLRQFIPQAQAAIRNFFSSVMGRRTWPANLLQINAWPFWAWLNSSDPAALIVVEEIVARGATNGKDAFRALVDDANATRNNWNPQGRYEQLYNVWRTARAAKAQQLGFSGAVSGLEYCFNAPVSGQMGKYSNTNRTFDWLAFMLSDDPDGLSALNYEWQRGQGAAMLNLNYWGGEAMRADQSQRLDAYLNRVRAGQSANLATAEQLLRNSQGGSTGGGTSTGGGGKTPPGGFPGVQQAGLGGMAPLLLLGGLGFLLLRK